MTVESSVPRHIGLILDGNRRWAKERNLPSLEGHRVGADNLKIIAEAAFDAGVEVLSAFVFSTENWGRTKEEVDYLMELITLIFKKYIKDFKKRGIRIAWLGTTDKLVDEQLKVIQKAIEETKNLTKGTLALCFNYGGRLEITEAVKKIIGKGVPANEVTPELVAENLYAPEIPDVDLIIRTSGEQRISNFMLWRAAYSEFLFVDKHWPEFSEADLDAALADYAGRQRRMGK